MTKFPPETEEKIKLLAMHEDINSDVRYYFGYQNGLGSEYIVPYLKAKGVQISSARICEIGCGESGVLAALADEGAAEVVGIDIRDVAIESSEKIFSALGIKAEFAIHNITEQATPEKWQGHFDIVLLRDVIEHLDETELSLRHVMDFMKPGGWLYVVFPPYYSPFGAHQHFLRNRVSKLPYIQLLPNAMFTKAYKNARWQRDVEEVTRLRKIRLTIGKMRRAIKNALFELVDEQLYFLRPVFKLKFGLPPVKANLLKHIPGLRELAALEASYLLRKRQT